MPVDSFVAHDEVTKPGDSFVAYDESTGGYKKGASESRIEHHLTTHPIRVVPELMSLAASPITGLAGIPQAISDWAHGRGSNGYPPGMGESPVNQAYSNALAALMASPGTPKPTIDTPPSAPPPSGPSGALPTQLPWLAKFAMRRLPMGHELVDIANNYLKSQAKPETAGFEPFKPSPITRSRMPTFVPGAEEQFKGTPGTIIPRKGFEPPPEVAPESPASPEPFKPGQATKRNLPKYVPGETDYGQPGKIIPRGKFEPPPEAAPEVPKAPEPFKPSSRTAKLIKGRPADNPYSSTPGRRIVGRGGRLSPPPEEAEATVPNKLNDESAVQAEIAKRSPTPAAPERPAPVAKEEIQRPNMADPEEVAKSAFHTAYRKFQKNVYQQELERVIREEIGPNKTRAYTPEGVAKAKALGKETLTPAEWDRVHRVLDKLPNKSIEPPPK